MVDEVDLGKVEDGFQTPGVVCKNCKAALAVVNDPATIPDHFRVRCPTCTHDDSYSKSEIALVEVRKRPADPQPRPN